MANQSVTSANDELFNGWHGKAWLRRMFLPQDFMDNISAVGAEAMVCHKTTNEYLVMSDKVEAATVTHREYGQYSTDLNYRPQEFQKESLKLIANASGVTCSQCAGAKMVACPSTMKCGACNGKGQENVDSCFRCDGKGKVDARRGSWYGRQRSCDICNGTGDIYRTCDKCRGSGSVRCDRCNGSGSVHCGQCEGAGAMVQGHIITRNFLPSQDVVYQLSGLSENEFKNGLAGKHFKSMPGDLIYQEFQIPANPETVLERKSVHSYDVLSQHYNYKTAEFCLNQITSPSSLKYAASGLPVSWVKVAVASLLSVAVAAGAIVALLFLT